VDGSSLTGRVGGSAPTRMNPATSHAGRRPSNLATRLTMLDSGRRRVGHSDARCTLCGTGRPSPKGGVLITPGGRAGMVPWGLAAMASRAGVMPCARLWVYPLLKRGCEFATCVAIPPATLRPVSESMWGSPRPGRRDGPGRLPGELAGRQPGPHRPTGRRGRPSVSGIWPDILDRN
jgi:hypothetical protein